MYFISQALSISIFFHSPDLKDRGYEKTKDQSNPLDTSMSVHF